MKVENDTIQYASGAIRERRDGKGRFDLISPFALFRLARWYEDGAKRYGERNWEKGIPFSHCLDSAFRHLVKFQMGKDDEDHLAAAAWNIFALIHYQELGRKDLNDLPVYRRRNEVRTVYLGGKITGRRFSEVWKERTDAAHILRFSGFTPIDPLEVHLSLAGRLYVPEAVGDVIIDDAFQEALGFSDAAIVEQDKDLLRKSDALLILTGDEVSSGTWLEFGYAKYSLGIPVVVVAKNPSVWTRCEASAVVSCVEEAVRWLASQQEEGRR